MPLWEDSCALGPGKQGNGANLDYCIHGVAAFLFQGFNSNPAIDDVRGAVYVPDGDVKINGNNGDLVMDQNSAKTYVVNGNSGGIMALKDKDQIFKFGAAGLVE